MTVTREDIDAMDRRVRAAFVNSLPGYKPANLIGSVSGTGQSNLAIVSSVVHLGSNPPLLAFMSRPLSVDRHTLQNIVETERYTINSVPAGMVGRAHQTAARYPREESEFEAAGFTEVYQEDFPAPFVSDSALRIGMAYHSQIQLPNETVMVIGEVVSVVVPDRAFLPDGVLDFRAIDATAVTGLDTYHRGEQIARYAYAKPDLPPREIS
jgi:flavin reductase (DIM6/NTAB) family NADH-FMN oxidoreductase RutF